MAKTSCKVLGVRGKTLHGQSRQILCNLVDYFKREKEAGGPVTSIKNVMSRACEASGVSESTLRRSLRERKEAEAKSVAIATPGQTRTRDAYVTNMKRGDVVALRAIIRKFYLEGKVPNLKKIWAIARRKLKFQGGTSSLSRIIKTKVGYHYVSLAKGGYKYLIEKDDIAVLRRQFLRKLRQFQAKARPIVYVDETWINERNSPSTCWQDAQGKGSLCYPASDKGQRLIVIHAGTTEGFVSNAKLIFASYNSPDKIGCPLTSCKKDSVCSDLTSEIFGKWFEEHLLPNIPNNSVIVLDNASYHSEELHSIPTSKSRRSDMIDWLAANGMHYDDTMVKAELYSLIKQTDKEKPGSSRYLIDELAHLRGHTVLRLPPYFCDFNPIDLIWSQVQGKIAERNPTGTLPLQVMQIVVEEELEKITSEDWRAAIECVTAIQSQFWQEDDLIDQQVEKLRNTTGRPKGDTGFSSDEEVCEEQVVEEERQVEKPPDTGSEMAITEFCSPEMMWAQVH